MIIIYDFMIHQLKLKYLELLIFAVFWSEKRHMDLKALSAKVGGSVWRVSTTIKNMENQGLIERKTKRYDTIEIPLSIREKYKNH